MTAWLSALLAQPSNAVLVTVAQTEGSVPREAGAKMLVTPDGQFDTIGGGHLELSACAFARGMLALPTDSNLTLRRLERFALGPTLGQCCGGVVWLAFERIDPAAHEFFAALQLRQRQGLESWRVVALDSTRAPSLHARNQRGLDAAADLPIELLGAHASEATHLVLDHSGKRWLIDPCLPHRAQLYLFGAGHVGAALVRALSELPCRITWVDARESMFPDTLPDNVTVEATDTPEVVIEHAPAGVSYLVMTHSHAQDQHLAEHILRRADYGWFGLIGSRTKRIQFERRLRQRGIGAERLHDMVCPIGIDGIDGKTPAVVAVAVAAQLLQVWEQQARAANAGRHYPPLPGARRQEHT